MDAEVVISGYGRSGDVIWDFRGDGIELSYGMGRGDVLLQHIRNLLA